jgi:hypothetical protein
MVIDDIYSITNKEYEVLSIKFSNMVINKWK